MYFNRKCKITFICHGATIYSEEGRLSDKVNYPPLNEAGQEEIEKLNEYLRLRGIKNDKIYASPSTRTVQSAQIIAKPYKTTFETIEDLTPRKCGDFSGLTYEQLAEKKPEEFLRLITDTSAPTPENAEAFDEFLARIKTTINRIIEENISHRIIIVTHPDVIQAAICDALDVPASAMQKIYIQTGSATQISYFESWKSLIYSGLKPL